MELDHGTRPDITERVEHRPCKLAPKHTHAVERQKRFKSDSARLPISATLHIFQLLNGRVRCGAQFR